MIVTPARVKPSSREISTREIPTLEKPIKSKAECLLIFFTLIPENFRSLAFTSYFTSCV